MATLDIPTELRDHEHYEILRELGRGGMGVVYLAQNRLMERLEVLKVVNQHLLDRADVKARFLREISSVAQFRHPNIVTAYTALSLGKLLALAMEYVEGEDLARLVARQGPLSRGHACYFVQQASLGLQHAFEKGLVHRDIKPHNLILGRDGKKNVIKILDFGLAKATHQLEAASGKLTHLGAMIGTALYMAPEQIKDAGSADIRSDLYSLGCTLYFLLSGKPPFEAQNQYGLMHAHLNREATPLNKVRKDVPAQLATVAAKMMAKDPAQRYQKPIEVAQALAPFVKGGQLPLPGREAQTTSPRTSTPASKSEVSRGGNLPDATPLPTVQPTSLDALPSQAPATGASRSKRWVLWAAVGAGVLLLVSGLGMWAGGVFELNPSANRVQGPNASGIELVWIPEGWFYMGSPADETLADKEEKPRHKVTISHPFFLGKYKVTVGQFKRFVAATGHQTEAEKVSEKHNWQKPGYDQKDDFPVVYVSWNDAEAYCQWLAKQSGAKVRLPREAEWEYCCRAQPNTEKTTRFYFGDDEAEFGKYGWHGGNSNNSSHPCGQKKPNAFGLYDMHGLAWEWCEDGKRTYENKEETDPVGPATGGLHMFRGGSWLNDPRNCAAARRNYGAGSLRIANLGFRVLVEH